MFRLLLLAIVITTFGLGLRRGWIEIHWDRVQGDLQLPLRFESDGRDPFRSYSRPRQAR